MRSELSPRSPSVSNRWRAAVAAAAVTAVVSASLVAGTSLAAPATAAPTGAAATAPATPTTGRTATAPVPPGPGQTSASTKSPHPTRQVCSTPTSRAASRCFALVRTDPTRRHTASPTVAPDGYGPADLQSAYALPAGAGAGRVVAIVDAFDNPNAEADLAVYRAQYGLPACTTANGCFRKVNQRGVSGDDPPADAGWAAEIALDVDMVSAACPACRILLVEADDNFNDNLAAGVDRAVALGATFVSNSYGGPEDPSQTAYDSTYSRPGVVVTASTGDDGYGASYPASSPGVTAVGGTSLQPSSGARGWTESAWSGAGSGCSAVEAKPAFQTDAGCPKRTVADVSAVADPNTGVAVYDTYLAPGWDVYGGTSASSPLIAATYALAGTPTAGTSPNSYPYKAPAGSLNDVTTGDNGTCTPAYLCTARTGYDGPTGLGTPHGTAAFTSGPHGTVAGTVKDSATGKPVVGAEVAVGAGVGLTGSDGTYSVTVPTGTYTETVSAYGYATLSVAAVKVGRNATVTRNVSLVAVPRANVSGTVTDGSGHGWPLYAEITLDGVPGAPVFTDPFTGRYSLDLPRSTTYTMHVAPVYPGYVTKDLTVKLGSAALVRNVPVTVDASSCDTAAGYTTTYRGAPIEHFDAATKPAGWKVTGDTTQGVWGFTDPGGRGNLTGGTGGFAIIDSDHLGTGRTQDTSLVSPVYDLAGRTAPVLDLNSAFRQFLSSAGDIDVTADAGRTWTTLLHLSGTSSQGPIELPLTAQAGKKVQVRFHYTGTFAYYWEVDDVFVGQKSCTPVAGGLVAGFVRDANTKAPLVGATVTRTDGTTDATTSTATPDDGARPDGFYRLFSAATGRHPFTAALGTYTSVSATVNVAANYVTRKDFALPAGRLAGPTTLTANVVLGATTTKDISYTNSGTEPVHVDLGERDGGFQILGVPAATAYAGVQGAPVQRVAGRYTPTRQAVPGSKAAAVRPTRTVTPSAAPWTAIADYPTPIANNVAVWFDGKVYDFGGYDGSDDTAGGYVYDPATGAWTAIAPMSTTREAAAAVEIGGLIYVTGGWGPDGSPTGVTDIYDPSTNSWTTGATNPLPHAAGAYGAIGATMYVVGGCDTDSCGSTDVQMYDTASNTWSSAADYPSVIAWAACGAIAGALQCAGGTLGTADGAASTATNAYDPASDSWTAEADAPADVWGGAFAAVGGRLVVSGGVIDGSTAVTNEGWAYDPATDAWATLPASNNAFYRQGSACGFYKIGGGTSNADPAHAESEVLPGFDSCEGSAPDVGWLSEAPTSFDVAPGATVTVTVGFDASKVSQPGTYTAQLVAANDSPYGSASVAVTMVVAPPKTFGKITGVVTGTACGKAAAPVAGATVQIDGFAADFTLTTDANGTYVLWLDRRSNPLTLIVAKDGWKPQTARVTVVAGATTTTNVALLPAKTC